MREIDIKLGKTLDEKRVVSLIDRAIKQAGLRVTMCGKLKAYPGCTHWHCKLGQEIGTLEITYWPAQKRAWFKVQRGRRAAWIAGKIDLLRELIERS